MTTVRISMAAILITAALARAAADVPVVPENMGDFTADHLSFQSRVQVATSCKEVFSALTDFKRLQTLVPHLNGKAKVAKATNPGDTLWYEFARKDGTKSTGRLVLTTIDENARLQVLVQPDQGPWLRVQEFDLYSPPNAKTCDVIYDETYNPRPLKNAAYNVKEIVSEIRAPYMDIILRRLKNLAEGKVPGPPEETDKLREIAKNFP
jgi:hypothetical protein